MRIPRFVAVLAAIAVAAAVVVGSAGNGRTPPPVPAGGAGLAIPDPATGVADGGDPDGGDADAGGIPTDIGARKPRRGHRPHVRPRDTIRPAAFWVSRPLHRRPVRRAPTQAPAGGTVSFDGPGQADNTTSGAGGYVPPDENLDVSPTQVVAWVNASVVVYDKTGAVIAGPLKGSSFWAGQNDVCSNRNDGDPIVLYDQLADRWIATQFAFGSDTTGPYYECIAVSTTGDATGAWNHWTYKWSDTKLDDYPKFGVTPSAYTMTINQFTDNAGTFAWAGAGVAAFDRAKMLAGDPSPVMVSFDLGANAATQYAYNLLPADVDGATAPPAGAPIWLAMVDSQDRQFSSNAIEVWALVPDFATPSASTLAVAATVPVPSMITSLPCGTDVECVPQPGTSQLLDPHTGKLLYRLAYRNLGSREALLATQVVRNVGGAASVRWYRLDRTAGTWGSTAVGTTPSDGTWRWLPSGAIASDGSWAIAYAVSSSTVAPGVAAIGHQAGDPESVTTAETTLFAGAGSQTTGSSRWGDYATVQVDPADDCLYWAIGEYYAASSARGFSTRIVSFRLPACGDVTPPTTPAIVSTSHPVGAATASHAVDVTLTPSTDASGIVGYAVSADQQPTADPAMLDGTATTRHLALVDGTWYLHVRARDTAGNWSASASYGPFTIDTTGPSGLAVSSPNHAVGRSREASVAITVGGASDPTGVAGYALVVDHAPAGARPGTPTDTGPVARSTSLADGRWYLHAWAVDAVGNWSAERTYGPITVDTSGPTGVTVTSPSNPPASARAHHGATVVVGGGVDAGSVAGYAVAADHDPAGVPAPAVTDLAPTPRELVLGEGVWYLHARAVDDLGTWGGTTTYGPFSILDAPTVMAAPVTVHGRTLDATVTTSRPTIGISYVVDHARTAVVDQTAEATGTHLVLTVAYGTWYVHLRAVGATGAGATLTVGPLRVGCVIPSVRGRTTGAATTALRQAGCGRPVIRRVAGAGVSRGRVLRSSPKAGTGVAAGTRVTLLVRR